LELSVQWFIAAVIENHILPVDICKKLIDACGDNVDLVTLAQKIIDDGLCPDVDKIQTVAEYAYNQAGGGQAPPMVFSIDNQIPPLENISGLSDQDLGKLMLQMLNAVCSISASDLHLSANSVPFLRLNLKVEKFGTHVLSAEDAYRLNTILLSPESKACFDQVKDLDFAMSVGSGNRVRCNLMEHKDGVAGTYRMIPEEIRELHSLGFPKNICDSITKMLDHNNGLILVTGPVNSGKTTTLAALVDIMNKKRKDHVVMVEDPLEIIQPSLKCNVTQREVGSHTKSFATALKGALREDPDIIVIGELRDLETIEMAITASETGHLVIGTLHTNDAASTLDRVLDVFPPSQQQQIRTMTAGSLRGIICQRLLPRKDGGLVAACELVIANIAVSNLISEGKTHQLKAVMQTGMRQGMCPMDQSVFDLFDQGIISYETTVANITNGEYLNKVQLKLATDAAAVGAGAIDRNKKKGWF
jgi:twitching motility protein PilT